MRKTIFGLLVASSMFCNVMAAPSVEEKIFGEYAIHFRWNKWTITDENQRQELVPLWTALAAHLDAKVTIVGWADPTGTIAANRVVSLRRAQNVAAYLIQKGFPEGQITTEGAGGRYYNN